MPGSTTHTYICYRALQGLGASPAYAPFKRIVESHEKALVHARKNDPKKLMSDREGVLAGCAYIGSCGPDLFYIEYDVEGEFVADLLHYNRTGPFVIRWLTELRQFAKSLRGGDRPALDRQLAYCLGHISHIAADIVIHPYVNSIVGAYNQLDKVFKNARGILFWKTPWKFHNILEHYQDAYILHERFKGDEKFGSDDGCVNLAAAAGDFLRGQEAKEYIGFVKMTKQFYRYSTTLDIEKYKYDFFANENTVVNLSGYYSDVIPDREMMQKVPRLTQGGPSAADRTGVFDAYVEKAVGLTLQMWSEVEAFLDVQEARWAAFADPDAHRLSQEELAAFPLLGRHWNLDCGLAPTVSPRVRTEAIAQAPDSALVIPGGIGLATIHDVARGDIA